MDWGSREGQKIAKKKRGDALGEGKRIKYRELEQKITLDGRKERQAVSCLLE